MNIKLLNFTIIVATAVCMVARAQATYRSGDAGPWNYISIRELHAHAYNYLKEIDAKIAVKKMAIDIPGNPFKEQAKKNLDELTARRESFLDSKWDCPYWHWKQCGKCVGTGRIWIGLRQCPDCNGNKGHNEHGNHDSKDQGYSCDPSTIRALLNIKE